jgi:hypothetical protein
MAQSAVAAIKRGTELLADGRGELQKFKSTVEHGIGEARAVYKEVAGLWSWIKGLFGAQPAPTVSPKPTAEPTPAVERVEKKTNRKQREPEPEISYEEYKIRMVNDVCERLKEFFEIRRKLREYCNELEEESKTTDRIENSAIDRVKIEIQLEDMMVQIREAMVYAPPEVGAIYSRFLKMYELILEEQEYARQVKRKTERDEKWRRDLIRNHRIDRAVVAVTVALLILWMWGFLLSLNFLVKTHSGLSSA